MMNACAIIRTLNYVYTYVCSYLVAVSMEFSYFSMVPISNDSSLVLSIVRSPEIHVAYTTGNLQDICMMFIFYHFYYDPTSFSLVWGLLRLPQLIVQMYVCLQWSCELKHVFKMLVFLLAYRSKGQSVLYFP